MRGPCPRLVSSRRTRRYGTRTNDGVMDLMPPLESRPTTLRVGNGERRARELEDEDPSRRQHANEFGQVPSLVPRLHVLEHDVGVDEVETRVVEPREIRPVVQVVMARFRVTVVSVRRFDHRWRDVDAPNIVEPGGKGLGEPADPTTEVEGATVRERHRKRLDEVHHLFDLLFAGQEELVGVPLPAALVVVREIRPERIGLAERIPMAPQALDVHLSRRWATAARTRPAGRGLPVSARTG